MSDVTIGFAGLTHLGICSLTAAASKGFAVVGWHDDEDLVSQINAAKLPVSEPDLDDLFAAHQAQMTFSSDPTALGNCDVVYIAFDVPTDDQGQSDLEPIETLLERIAPQLRDDAVLVVLCQVSPGFTRAHHDVHPNLYYQVETLVFGRAVERACLPERLILGVPDPDAALPAAYETFLKSFDCPIMPMRYESAELCKIAINCFLVASVATANTLADLCEGLGADWSEIIPALWLDQRIGQHAYIKPGLGISGGNLERDLASVVRLADATSQDSSVVETYRTHSRYAKNWPFRVLENAFGADLASRKVALLGLAYKEETHSTKNSPALELLDQLGDMSVVAYDPLVKDVARSALGFAEGALAAAEGADVICLMTPWPEFRNVSPGDIAARMRGNLVVDPYELWDTDACAAAGLIHAVRGREINETKA
jgi:UDPglucose 6-dehydrogenase